MTDTCSLEGCALPVAHRGWCNKHYIRWQRHGSPAGGRVRKLSGKNACGKKQCPAARKIWGHFDYRRKADKYKANAHKNYWKDPDRQRALARARIDHEKNRAKTRAWTRANPEHKRRLDAEFKAKNPALVTSYKAARRARQRQATPAWLTPEHWVAIREKYIEARRKSEETGVEHEVDHIVPLQGRTVCGLHVPWNLRILSRDENNRRPRVFSG